MSLDTAAITNLFILSSLAATKMKPQMHADKR